MVHKNVCGRFQSLETIGSIHDGLGCFDGLFSRFIGGIVEEDSGCDAFRNEWDLGFFRRALVAGHRPIDGVVGDALGRSEVAAWRPPGPGSSQHLARVISTSRTHKKNVDVCSFDHQLTLCGTRRIRGVGGAFTAVCGRHRFGNWAANEACIQSKDAVDWLRSLGFFGGAIQGPCGRDYLCG